MWFVCSVSRKRLFRRLLRVVLLTSYIADAYLRDFRAGGTEGTRRTTLLFSGLLWEMKFDAEGQECSKKLRSLIVMKFQNENVKSPHSPKYEGKNLKNSALSIQDLFSISFYSYFGQCDDFTFYFWNFLTYT